MSAPVFLAEGSDLRSVAPGGIYVLDGAEGRHKDDLPLDLLAQIGAGLVEEHADPPGESRLESGVS